jgi:EAL domain-containing protein (putative c-di-GMP-specific phosphodiesterase class I)
MQLGRDLDMTIVVEGVEDACALEALREWGCDIAQGHHVGRPMPAASFPGRPAGHAATPAGRLPR